LCTLSRDHCCGTRLRYLCVSRQNTEQNYKKKKKKRNTPSLFLSSSRMCSSLLRLFLCGEESARAFCVGCVCRRSLLYLRIALASFFFDLMTRNAEEFLFILFWREEEGLLLLPPPPSSFLLPLFDFALFCAQLFRKEMRYKQ